MKPTLLEIFEEAIVAKKHLLMIGVIKDDEPKNYSKDVSRKSQVMVSKGKDNEATNIETLTPLIKNLTTEVFDLKQWKTNRSARSHLLRQRYVSSSSRINQFTPKTMQKPMF